MMKKKSRYEPYYELSEEELAVFSGEDLKSEIVSDSVLKEGVEKNKDGWCELCSHPDALFYQDCICYNSVFCRKKCEFRNKGEKPEELNTEQGVILPKIDEII